MEATTTTRVHCKISFNGQIRRFALDSTEFTSLKETIAKLFSIQTEFVLKYCDDESDYVTIDSQSDLLTAIDLFPTMLRIDVILKDYTKIITVRNYDQSNVQHEQKNNPTNQKYNPTSTPTHQNIITIRNYGQSNIQHEQKNNPTSTPTSTPTHQNIITIRNYDLQPHPQNNTKLTEQKKLSLAKKLVSINQNLRRLGTDDTALSPRSLLTKQKLIRTKQRIEYNLNGSPKKLTLEQEQFNLCVKAEILGIKIDLAKVKAREREIHIMMQDNDRDPDFIKALNSVKEQKLLLKKQKQGLKDQLYV